MTEDAAATLTDSGTITFTDVDLPTSSRVAGADGTSPPGRARRAWPRRWPPRHRPAPVPAASSTWTYSARLRPVEYLADGDSSSRRSRSTFTDSNGTVTQTIIGHHHRHQRRAGHRGADLTGAVTELVDPGRNLTDSGTITFTDVDLTDVHQRRRRR